MFSQEILNSACCYLLHDTTAKAQGQWHNCTGPGAPSLDGKTFSYFIWSSAVFGQKMGQNLAHTFFRFSALFGRAKQPKVPRALHSVNPVRQLLNYRRCCQPLRYAFNDNFSLPRCKKQRHPFGVVESPRLTNSLI